MLSLPSSPFSSPPSSPSVRADSSPPSSPTLTPLNAFQTSPGPSHPFAGSTKAIRPPPLYEKRGTKRPRVQPRWAGEVDSDRDEQDVYIDETPSRRASHWNPDVRAHDKTRVVTDPFAGSAKREWIPPVYEKKVKIRSRSTFDASSVRSSFGSGSSTLQEPFVYHPPPAIESSPYLADTEDLDLDSLLSTSLRALQASQKIKNTEQRRWDDAIGRAIAQADGIIDLSASGVLGTVFTYIPSSIGDLSKLVLLKAEDDGQIPRPPSKRSGTPESNAACNPGKRVFARSLTVPSCQPGQSIFDYAPPQPSSQPQGSTQVPLIVSTDRPYETTGIQLILEKNSISQLPPELFSVISITVLNLQSNLLPTVPPQIAQLVNLKQLHLKNNRLRYLPAEMLSMRLRLLELDGNSWLTAEELSNTQDSSGEQPVHAHRPILPPLDRTERFVSDTKASFIVAPLTEYCLRVLLAPHQAEHPQYDPSIPLAHTIFDSETEIQVQNPPWPQYSTNLAAYHTLPLSTHHNCPAHVLDTLRACLPDSVARPDTRTHVQGQATSPQNRARRDRPVSMHEEIFSFAPPTTVPQTPPHTTLPVYSTGGAGTEEAHADEVPHIGVCVCPSPGHVPHYSRVFVQHAEERYSWEHVIAGCEVRSPHGIPIHWRGCSPGCLRFLDMKTDAVGHAAMNYTAVTSNGVEAVDVMDVDFDMDSQSEDGFGVEAMDLSGGLDDFD